MAQIFEVHPDNPQPRSIAQVAEILRGGGLIAYASDSGFALGCSLGNREALERIRRIRSLGKDHHFSLVVSEFAQLGAYVDMNTATYRAIKAATPGPYTFILRATKDVPKVMQHPKKRTVGVRVPHHTTTLALLAELGEPLMSSTLVLPGDEDPLRSADAVAGRIGNDVDAILESGDAGVHASTLVDFSDDVAEVLRVGGGDPTPFE